MVRTMEVLAEPLLEVTPEGFAKEVVRLEDGVDVTHPTKWETSAGRVDVPMGSSGPAISTNPPELSMEVPAAPNQSANNYDVAGYHLMQALFPPEIHEQLHNTLNPNCHTLHEWCVHSAGYLGVRLQTQRDTVTWFPLPL